MRSPSRGITCPKFCNQPCPRNQRAQATLQDRGRREDRVLAAPTVSQAVAKELCCLQAYRFGGFTPAFPAQWLYGLYEIVLVTLLFVTPSPCETLASSRVDACIGASDPNDFTVRKDRARQSRLYVHRFPPPRLRRWPTPLWWDRMAGVLRLICPTCQSIYF